MKKRKFDVNEKQYAVMPVEIKGIDKEKFTLEAIFSTSKEDRHGDVVLQEGWDLKNFKKNPVILNSHNYGDATEVIGKASNVKVVDGKLEGKITFAVNENPKAKVIFDLYAGGFLNAFSVGFMVKKFAELAGETDYFTISESELLEVSAVSVPANAYALAKSKGIDVDSLEASVDDEDEQDIDEDIEDEEIIEEKSCEECERVALGKEKEEQEEKTDEVVGEKTISKKESYILKVARVIKSIETEEKKSLERVSIIIKSLLDGNIKGKIVDEKIQEQVRKRKINQAIRELMKNK